MIHPVPEIMAPAGSPEAFRAALQAGADSVYLGLSQFNARSGARNFSLAELEDILPVARSHQVPVYITLNTLIKQNEVLPVVRLLERLVRLPIAGIIVQDWGLVRLCRQYFPDLRIHASTQMALHEEQGVLFAAEEGIKRVVLARELTLNEIRTIQRKTEGSGVELEIFAHGSLCYSYSGLCFFSGADNAGSGNRGECAYTCREPFRVTNEPGQGFLFSMRDLNTLDIVPDLCRVGVRALKIEGRKKDAQYVLESVVSYRRALNKVYGRDTSRASAPKSARRLSQAPEKVIAGLLREGRFSFHREKTHFFLSGRYRENVIDLDEVSHGGSDLGTVLEQRPGRARVKLRLPLRRRDGLRLVQSDRLFHAAPQHGGQQPSERDRQWESLRGRFGRREPEFSLQSIQKNGRQLNEAGAGETVWLGIPDAVSRLMRKNIPPENRAGKTSRTPKWRLVKVRSALLREKTTALTKARGERPLRDATALRMDLFLFTGGPESGVISEGNIGNRQLRWVARLPRLGNSHRLPPLMDAENDPGEKWGEGQITKLRPDGLYIRGTLNLPAATGGRAGVERWRGKLAFLGDFELAADRVFLWSPGVNNGYPADSKMINLARREIGRTVRREWNRLWEEHTHRLEAELASDTPTTGKVIVAEKGRPPEKSQSDGVRTAIRVDRPGYIPVVLKFIEGRNGNRPEASGRGDPGAPGGNPANRRERSDSRPLATQFDEIVFEVKKTFLGRHEPRQLLERLRERCRRSGVKLRLAFPLVNRIWDRRIILEWLAAARDLGHREFEISGVGLVRLIQQEIPEPLDLTTEFSLYVTNHLAAEFWAARGCHEVSLHFEDDQMNYAALGHRMGWRGERGFPVPRIILYRDLPLFYAESCALTALHDGCPGSRVCGYRTLEIRDRRGQTYKVVHENCKSSVISDRVFCLFPEATQVLRDQGVAAFRLDFVTRQFSRARIRHAMESFVRGRALPNTHSSNFFKIFR